MARSTLETSNITVAMSTDQHDSPNEQQRQFETLQREITVAAREQGGDPGDNFRLRYALRRAEDANMPEEVIEQARKRGAGEADGPDLHEVTFEGYGPDGVAVLVEAITDDASQTAHELAELFEAHGGNLGEDGCVAWQFERRGLVQVEAADVDDADAFMLEVIEMGADELKEPLFDKPEGGRVPAYRVFCDPTDVRQVVRAMDAAGYGVHTAGIVYEPDQRVELDPGRARNFLNFFEKLLGRPDVQDAYANWSVG